MVSLLKKYGFHFKNSFKKERFACEGKLFPYFNLHFIPANPVSQNTQVYFTPLIGIEIQKTIFPNYTRSRNDYVSKGSPRKAPLES